MQPSQKLINTLLKAYDGNKTKLADALSDHTGRKVHRQQVQRWCDGTAMTYATFSMLEGFQKFGVSGIKKRERDKRYRTKKGLTA